VMLPVAGRIAGARRAGRTGIMSAAGGS
jgi:hypothetical protein